MRRVGKGLSIIVLILSVFVTTWDGQFSWSHVLPGPSELELPEDFALDLNLSGTRPLSDLIGQTANKLIDTRWTDGSVVQEVRIWKSPQLLTGGCAPDGWDSLGVSVILFPNPQSAIDFFSGVIGDLEGRSAAVSLPPGEILALTDESGATGCKSEEEMSVYTQMGNAVIWSSINYNRTFLHETSVITKLENTNSVVAQHLEDNKLIDYGQ